MKKILQFTLILISFLTLYAIMNYYVYLTLIEIIDYRYLWAIILVLSASFPVISALERFVNGRAIGYIYFASMAWTGTAFIMFVSFLILDAIKLFISFDYRPISAITLGIASVISFYALFNAQNLTIRKTDIRLKRLKKDIKIAQLSDIHVGTIHKERFLKKIIANTNKEQPDIVVITGDLFDGSGMLTDKMLSPLKEIESPAFFITGNHENYLGKETAKNFVKKNKIKVLSNASVKIKGIQLIGIDAPDREMDAGVDKLKDVRLDKKLPNVLLYHLPILQDGADLQLSGHTHNGQIFPFTLLVKAFFGCLYGLYKKDDSYIYVSSGIGTWGPPMRLLAPSEIVIHNLKKMR